MILVIRTMFEHSHKKRKDSVETRAVLLIVSLERKLSGDFYEELLGENYLEAILTTLCQDLWGNSENRCRSKRVSHMFLVCYNLLNSQNMPVN